MRVGEWLGGWACGGVSGGIHEPFPGCRMYRVSLLVGDAPLPSSQHVVERIPADAGSETRHQKGEHNQLRTTKLETLAPLIWKWQHDFTSPAS